MACAGLALDRTGDVTCHPASIETTGLRTHALACNFALKSRRIERKPIRDPGKCRGRIRIAPGGRLQRRLTGNQNRPVAGASLPLAMRGAFRRDQQIQIDIFRRQVEGRRTRGLDDAQRANGICHDPRTPPSRPRVGRRLAEQAVAGSPKPKPARVQAFRRMEAVIVRCISTSACLRWALGTRFGPADSATHNVAAACAITTPT